MSDDIGFRAQVGAAVVAGLMVVIPLAFAWARHKLSAQMARAEAEAAIAQAEVVLAKNRLAEAQRLSEALTKGVERATSAMPRESATRTKELFAATAESMGVGDALADTVERLGFAKARTAPSMPTSDGKP